MNGEIKQRIEEFAGSEVIDSVSLSGGCVGSASRICCRNERSFFLKIYSDPEKRMAICEGHGLRELSKARCINVPEVFIADESFLLLELIGQGRRDRDFFSAFGRQFAQLHKTTSDNFGFYEDNYIGSTPQYNCGVGVQNTSWVEFYWMKRLQPQFRLAERNGYVDSAMTKKILRLESAIESILAGSEERPSLLHGDLWSGNFLAGSDGAAWLIDPAVYYGHREADLAMTVLFDGFDESFYAAYAAELPLADGYEYRQGLYLLYHVMNHLNLFGLSYHSQALNLIDRYI